MLPGHYNEESFTATGNGIISRLGDLVAKSWAISVSSVGGLATSWIVILEGSIDGANFSTILTHTEIDPGEKQVVYSGAAHFPSLYVRVRVLALSLGTASSIKVNHLGA